MKRNRVLARGVAALIVAAGAVPLTIGGAEAAGFFKEATGFDSESNSAATTSLRRSLPNGRTDIIKVMGNTKWGRIE